MLNPPSPLVSIILPTYNRDWVITQAIDSVLAQSYTNFELIIIDDGSTDKTTDVIKSYEGKLQYVYTKNSGVAKARNRGISISKGKFIAFIDSDDTWEPQKLAKQILFLSKNPSYGLCYCGAQYFHNKNLERDTISHYKNIKNGFIFSELLKQPSIATPTVIIRADIIENVGTFNEKFKLFEDRDLWLRVALNNKIHFVPELLVNIHRFSNANNLTNQESEMRVYYQLLLKELLATNKHLNIFDRLLIRNQLAHSLHDSAYIDKNRNHIDSSIKLYKESFLNNFSVRTLLILIKLMIKNKYL